MNIQMGYSKIGKYAQEAWEKNWVNPDMFTVLLLNATLFNMYNPIPMETILKALREQSFEDD